MDLTAQVYMYTAVYFGRYVQTVRPILLKLWILLSLDDQLHFDAESPKKIQESKVPSPPPPPACKNLQNRWPQSEVPYISCFLPLTLSEDSGSPII